MPRLEIDTYFVEELLVKSNSDYESNGASREHDLDLGIDFDFYRKGDDDPRFLVRLSMEFGDAVDLKLPYHIRLSLFAAFDASKDSNQTTIEQLVATNAAPILYGIARGIVGQATAQAIHGRYVLPTVNFIDLVKAKAQALPAADSE
jgi:preprotein translocase subunit SecB